MRAIILIVITLLSSILTGCHSEQYRWSRSPDYVETYEFQQFRDRESNEPSVSVYTYATQQPTEKNIGLQNLSDHGQQAYIENLPKLKSEHLNVLKDFLRGKSSPNSDNQRFKLVEASTYDRTLVVSVAKGLGSKPGDRLLKTVVEIVPSPPGEFEFGGYDIPATDVKLRPIAHVSNKTETAVSSTLTPTFTGFLQGSGTTSASVTNSAEGAADIDQQYQNLSIDITPNKVSVVRESERGLDLAGNTIISPLTIVLPPKGMQQTVALASPSDDFFSNGEPKKPQLIDLAPVVLQLPSKSDLKVNVRLIYQARIPDERSRKYYVEGEQIVTIQSGIVRSEDVPIVRKSELVPTLYRLREKGSGSALLLEVGEIRIPLVFSDFLTANRFASWVNNTHSSSVGKNKYRLTLRAGSTLSASDQFEAEVR